MALIHVVHHHVYKPEGSDFLRLYRRLKFKMKMSYEAWVQRVKLKDLVLRAIFKTLNQLQNFAHY